MDSSAEQLITNEQAMDEVPFGRNRLLAAAGGLLFGLAASMSGKSSVAWAGCGDNGVCVDFPKCCCCSGSRCCVPGWNPTTTCWSNNEFCWQTCNTAAGVLMRCCDWRRGTSNDYCICRTAIGSC